MKIKMISGFLICSALIMLFLNCSKEKNIDDYTVFKPLHQSETGIGFSNNLTENDSLNYFTYSYLYMGGGVAVGDINNDGLKDVFFTGNQVSNKLYLNKGNLRIFLKNQVFRAIKDGTQELQWPM